MPFFLVSRERLVERDATIAELKKKIESLEADRKHWDNWRVYLQTGTCPYPDLLPRVPSMVAPVTPKPEGMEQEIPTGLEAAKKRAGTGNPRALMTLMQRDQDEKFAVATGQISPPEPKMPPIPKGQAEVASTILKDIEDAQKGA